MTLTRKQASQPGQRTFEAVLATERRTPVYDMRLGQIVDEELRLDGMSFPPRVPLLDTHRRGSVDDMLGDVRNIHVEGGRLVAVLRISSSAERAYRLVRDGHLTGLSIGYTLNRHAYIGKRQSKTVMGRDYTAGDRILRVAMQTRMLEASLLSIPADPDAKIIQT